MPRPSSAGRAALSAHSDPQGLAAYVLKYLDWLQIHNYAAPTVQNRQSYLGVFVAWCTDRGLVTPREITKPILERYQRSLYILRKANGEPLTFRAQHARLIPVRAFFKWCAKQNYLLYNPIAWNGIKVIREQFLANQRYGGEIRIDILPDVPGDFALRLRRTIKFSEQVENFDQLVAILNEKISQHSIRVEVCSKGVWRARAELSAIPER